MTDQAPPLYPYARHPDQDAAAPAHHPVVIVGAGPVGLALAIDLGQRGIPAVVLDENDRVSTGSRAICFAKRTLEIGERLGVGRELLDMGVDWNLGKVFAGDRRIYEFNLLPEAGHRFPAFVNLQQYHVETVLTRRLRALQASGAPVQLRGGSRLTALAPTAEGAELEIDSPDGPYRLSADWVVACDGANSACRSLLRLDFEGEAFEDNFLIADVRMKADFPTERWFWFDPPFNPGRSALLHKQPDGVWRIDLQLGEEIDREAEKRPENVIPRLEAMLGPDVDFDLEWVSIYTFQCRRMASFREGRVIFAGDAAHQVSPFGARGANSGIQDADNLGWKLAATVRGEAPETLLDSYDSERVQAADENIAASTRSTEFITPKTPISRLFRDAVLDLAGPAPFARLMVNSGRLSVPTIHDGSALLAEDGLPDAPADARPGAPCPDAPFGNGFLLDRLGTGFTMLDFGTGAPEEIVDEAIPAVRIQVRKPNKMLKARYLGPHKTAIYLIRPDGHVVGRWADWRDGPVRAALRRAMGRPA